MIFPDECNPAIFHEDVFPFVRSAAQRCASAIPYRRASTPHYPAWPYTQNNEFAPDNAEARISIRCSRLTGKIQMGWPA